MLPIHNSTSCSFSVCNKLSDMNVVSKHLIAIGHFVDVGVYTCIYMHNILYMFYDYVCIYTHKLMACFSCTHFSGLRRNTQVEAGKSIMHTSWSMRRPILQIPNHPSLSESLSQLTMGRKTGRSPLSVPFL